MAKPRPRHILLAFLLIASVAFLFYVIRSARVRTAAGAAPAGQKTGAPPEETTARALAPAAPADVDFDRYQVLASRRLFSESRPAPPPAPTSSAILPPPPLTPDQPPRPRPPDLSGWTYTGYIAIDGRKMGLIQNESSESAEELEVGETFLGATVTEITGEAMRLKSGSSVITLRTPEIFSLVPLDKKGEPLQPGRPPLGGRRGPL